VGANIKAFPFSSPVELVNAVGFLGSLTAMIFVSYLYWIKLNVFQTMAYGTVVGVPLLFFGKFALSDVAKWKKFY
jgi:hypothetical protein